jgi:hypothetical protein
LRQLERAFERQLGLVPVGTRTEPQQLFDLLENLGRSLTRRFLTLLEIELRLVHQSSKIPAIFATRAACNSR